MVNENKDKGAGSEPEKIEPDATASKGGEEKPVIKKTVETAGRVQLRADAEKEVVKQGLGKWKWLLIGGGIFGLIVVGGVVGVLTLPGRDVEVDNGEDDTGLFRQLPEALQEIGKSGNESGLSGRKCEDADRRPVGVMLASDVITRPLAGFADADLVFELPVLVSNVTRFLAVYQCGRPDDIGSVRSVRHDYLFLGEGVDAIIGHWGGSYHALNRIAAGEFNTINALTNPFAAYFRKDSLPAPYNGFTTYDNLWNALQKLGYRVKTEFKGYDFKDDVKMDERPIGGTLSIAWPGSFRVHYEYDQETNRYQRFWGGVKQIDGGAGKEDVAPSVVAVMRATNEFADGPGGYNDVGIEGEGALEVYQDGKVIKGTWHKNALEKTDPLKFKDEQGKEITFTRGQVWIAAVESSVAVTWEEAVSSPVPDISELPEPSTAQ
jgi:hypothetical protein